MNLSRAKFLYGCYGYNLDVLARGPIWDLDLDFQCGTGHGVGYLANVHEPPTGFRWYVVPSKNEHHKLEEGMVITDGKTVISVTASSHCVLTKITQP